MRRTLALVLLSLLLVALAPAASAQVYPPVEVGAPGVVETTTTTAPAEVLGEEAVEQPAGAPAAVEAGSGGGVLGSLARTGFGVALLVAVALVSVLVGSVLVARSRRPARA